MQPSNCTESLNRQGRWPGLRRGIYSESGRGCRVRVRVPAARADYLDSDVSDAVSESLARALRLLLGQAAAAGGITGVTASRTGNPLNLRVRPRLALRAMTVTACSRYRPAPPAGGLLPPD